MARTAPPGYDSNYSAIMDLIRFGPVIWSCAQFAALLYHAERSTAYGKESDQHSEKQATEGIYSSRQLAWVRGPSGLSRASWYSANAALELDPDEPSKTPDGVLRRIRGGSGRGRIVEYEVDWLAVRARIARWKEGSKFWTLPEEKRVRILDSKGPKIGPFPENCAVDNNEASPEEGSKIWTQQSTLTLQSDLNSPSDGHFPTRSAVSLEIELACGERPRTDLPANQILTVNRKLGLPMRCVARFLHERAADFRSRHYPCNPGLLAKSFAEDVIKWSKVNRNFIDDCLRDIEVARRKQQAVTEMNSPAAPAAETPNPDFNDRTVADLTQRMRKLR